MSGIDVFASVMLVILSVTVGILLSWVVWSKLLRENSHKSKKNGLDDSFHLK